MRMLATAEVPAIGREKLADLGTLQISRGCLPSEVADVDILLVRAERVDAQTLTAAKRLRAIARTGVGVDNVDVTAASERGIAVLNAPVAGTAAVAEGAWALILAAAKRLGELRACVEQGRWAHRYAIEGLDLHGATLGIVGLGSIGREVARIGLAFGMRVLAVDPRLSDDLPLERAVERTDLEDLVRRSDVISLHCELDESNRGLINRRLLSLARRRPVLVNAARGGVVDGDELLLEALREGWLSAVGLDVFATEPLRPDSPLLEDPRVILTPHSIGLTREWNERVFDAIAADLRTLLSGGRPRNIVNPQVLAESKPVLS
ncbi:MAG TPA: NAD(P)-dependent oxidoreductase [Solirubrobacteraceae bacterium]|jgi:phosphoglycerate dehydrogenase-like enzyme|nr:NAD(P)-dependent oxidoreductase [Solirubrobacteraceae bacterium]